MNKTRLNNIRKEILAGVFISPSANGMMNRNFTSTTLFLTLAGSICVFSLFCLESLSNADSQVSPNTFHQGSDTLANQNSSEFRFVAVGDWGCNEVTVNTVNDITQRNPDLILALGDYSYENTADCWLKLVDSIDEKMKIIIGNHETRIVDAQGYRVDSTQLLYQYLNHFNMTNPYYSFNKGNIHFLVLSTETEFDEDSAQFKFAVDDLSRAANNPAVEWIVVAYHRQITYNSHTSAGDDGSDRFRDVYHPLFERYNVDLVLMAHQHNYERTYPLRHNNVNPETPIIADRNMSHYNRPEGQVFAIIGTGGAHLYRFLAEAPNSTALRYEGFGLAEIKITKNPGALNLTFFNQEGKIEDTFVVTKLPQQQVVETDIPQRLPESKNVKRINDSSTGFYKSSPFGTFLGNNSLDIEHNSLLNLTEFTLSTWFRIGEGFPSNATRQYLVTKGGTGSDSPGKNMNYGLNFRNGDGTIRGGFEDINGSSYTVASRNPVNDSQWHYVTITYNQSDLIMYLDGEQIDIKDTGRASPDSTGTLPLIIGGNADDKDYFSGDIDEVRLWKRALDGKEVKKAYEDPNFSTEGEVLHLPFSNASSTLNHTNFR